MMTVEGVASTPQKYVIKNENFFNLIYFDPNSASK